MEKKTVFNIRNIPLCGVRSTNPEELFAAIQSGVRLICITPVGLDKANEERKAAERSQGKQQIAESLSHLDKKKSAGIEKVTDVRVAADWREAQRRVADEKKRQDRLQRLQEEAVSSGKQNAIIEARWAELVEQNIPRELHDAIEVGALERPDADEALQRREHAAALGLRRCRL